MRRDKLKQLFKVEVDQVKKDQDILEKFLQLISPQQSHVVPQTNLMVVQANGSASNALSCENAISSHVDAELE